MGERARVCNFCPEIPAPKLIGRATKPEHFMEMTEAHDAKVSTAVTTIEGHQHETSALIGATSGLFDVKTQPGDRRAVLMDDDVKVPDMKKKIVRCFMSMLYAKAAPDVAHDLEDEVDDQLQEKQNEQGRLGSRGYRNVSSAAGF